MFFNSGEVGFITVQEYVAITTTISVKEVVKQAEDIYNYLLNVYGVKDDLTMCTLWQMVKDGVFNHLMDEKGLLPF